MDQICEKDYCSGCYACYNSCIFNAISMVEGGPFGHIYPKINHNKCTDCKKCISVCPVNKQISHNTVLNCYAAKANEEDRFPNSSSGGIGSLLIENHINNKGIVYCAMFNENLELIHKKIKSKKDIEKAAGSKYVQSNIGNTYQKIEKDLINNKKVLFIGTPCQVAGLLSFVGQKNKNLTTVDFVCHGVPSQNLLNNELNKLSKIKLCNNILFREKHNVTNYNMQIFNKDKLIAKQRGLVNPYIYLFLKSITIRNSCFNCNYSSSKRVSDITLGDFWGLPESSKFYKQRNIGVSLVLINSTKGEAAFKLLDKKIAKEQQNLNMAIRGNDHLNQPANKPKIYKKFINTYNKTNNLKTTFLKYYPLQYLKNLIFFK